MADIEISIKSNGKTTLKTAGKYCPGNIGVHVDVAGDGGRCHRYENLTYDESTKEYSAVCSVCGEKAVWGHLRGRLPEEVLADLPEVGYDLDFVYDGGADDFGLSTYWERVDDEDSLLGKAVRLQTNASSPMFIPGKDHPVYIGEDSPGTPVVVYDHDALRDNNGKGYVVYKWKNITIGNSGYDWLNLWDGRNIDGPLWDFPREQKRKAVDLYISVKVENWTDSTSPAFSIDRIILLAYCGDKSQTDTEMIEGSLRTIRNESVEAVRKYGFYGLQDLQKVDFPHAKIAGTLAFAKCTGLKEVQLPSLKQNAGATFEDCTALEHIDLPAMESVRDYCFSKCTNLTSVVLRRTDAICSLSSVLAFNETPFAKGGSGGKVYVPEALLESYKTATNWSALHCEFVPLEGSEYQ